MALRPSSINCTLGGFDAAAAGARRARTHKSSYVSEVFRDGNFSKWLPAGRAGPELPLAQQFSHLIYL